MTALNDFKRLSGTLFVDGAWTASASTAQLDVIDPATEDRIGHIADATDAEVDQAIAVATALKGAGIETVYIAGRRTETGAEDTSVIDGEVFDGMDVVAFLEGTLDRIGVAQ